jgi:hypothetical protein
MAPSPDNSSYNIHIYSGDQPGNTYDDVWALLIPSFIWVKMYEGIKSIRGMDD